MTRLTKAWATVLAVMLMMSKKPQYKKILPLEDNKRVEDQFGWLPLSVIEPPRETKNIWRNAYLDDDSNEIKRSVKARWLAGLKYSEFHAGLAKDILYYWSVIDSVVVDPFAGRVTRAFMTTALGRKYYGYEISPTTLQRVESHLKRFNMSPDLYLSDGCQMSSTPNNFADLVMTCPPYHQLEKYESVPHQLSDIKNYEDFMARMDVCAVNVERVLKPGGFLVWVCGDWRDGKEYRPFHADCINLFKGAGLIYHDLIVMRNQSPFAALQVGKVAAKRYTSKVHEFILVFRKEGELIPPSDVIRKADFDDVVDIEQNDLFA